MGAENAFLSIPAWFDWRGLSWATYRLLASLSIPAWFDWRGRAGRPPSGAGHLSIPAWFDWRHPTSASEAPSPPTFNPSLVRLAPARAVRLMVRIALSIPAWFDWRPATVRTCPGLPIFQSQLGSIGALSCRAGSGGAIGFQSQLGSIGAS